MNPSEPAETFADRVDAFADLGVPEAVRAYIAAQTFPRAWRVRYFILAALAVLATLGVPCAVGFALFRLGASFEATRTESGFFSAENHGWAALILAFGLGLGAACAITVAPRLLGARFSEYVAIRGLASASTQSVAGATAQVALAHSLTRSMYRSAAARVGDAEPRRFLAAQLGVATRWFVWPACAMIAIGLVALPIDLGRYAVGTADGVHRHSVFGESFLPWSALDRVEVGCAEFTSSNSSSVFSLYEFLFAGGDRVTALLHPTARAVDRLAELDGILRARGVPVRRAAFKGGANVGKPVWTPGCTEALASKTGADAARLHRIFLPGAL